MDGRRGFRVVSFEKGLKRNNGVDGKGYPLTPFGV
jgi:hypothetical protein